MRAIVVMFDTLNRRMLPQYGGDIEAPNFARLAERTATFDQCYAGSMPCMPARRELHTGRYNFLHRSWGPLEPFDDSVPEMLKKAGVYTHLATDHQHYFEDGGGTYHARFNSWEFFRGQEGDTWKGHVADPTPPPNLNPTHFLARQDWINREYLTDEADHPQTRTFDAGLHFLETNADEDRWLLHLETFDPHEPFFSYEKYKAQKAADDDGVVFDWPGYRRVTETDAQAEKALAEYQALVRMCDASLGRVLDAMDEHEMWDDTMLIVCTDHGFLLGEHGWWGKSVMPWYDETIHTPLHIWDPRSRVRGERRDAVVQTVDIGPTLLDFFGEDLTADMQGRPLADAIAADAPVREAALFGAHGSHVSVADGRYVYMRACATPANGPLFDYTLMPTHMRSRFTAQELHGMELHDGFSFTKRAPVLRIPAWAMGNPGAFGTLLFDLETDPQQQHPLRDDELETRMAELLVAAMRANDAPPEQFERLGLPPEGPIDAGHLLIERQWDRIQSSRAVAARASDVPAGAIVATVPIGELLEDPRYRDIVAGLLPATGPFEKGNYLAGQSLLNAVAGIPGSGADQVIEAESSLSAAG
jgi:arylsulfatase A-like enzyme